MVRDEMQNGAARTPVTEANNWFNRHLNWTWIFALLGCYFFAFVLGMIWYIFQIAPKVGNVVSGIMPYATWVIVMVPASIWVLRKKQRSMWWLLLSGMLSPLWLANRREAVLDVFPIM